MKFKNVILLTIISGLLTNSFAVQPQTVRDSMDGNWAVINGKKVFLSGMNIAWLSNNTFGRDVGDSKADMNLFASKVKQIRKAGGNCLRWWLHTDASNCPKIDSDGKVTGLGSKTIENMKAGLDTAYAYGVVVSMCLFSFDMLVPGDGAGKADYSDYNLEANHKFLTEPSNLDTYLENGLRPIMETVGSHPAVMCWEVFNEPEGMLASANWGHVMEKISQNDILRITNKIAGFVHRNSMKMASTGIAETGYTGEYSDESLIAAGGDEDGYLDFYMVHYYPEWAGQEKSPFHNPVSYWGMDRPVLIGEFPAKSWSTSTTGPGSNQSLKTSKTITDAFKYAYDNGYAGAMSWCMSEPDSGSLLGNYLTTAPALEALFNEHKDDIMIKDVVIEEMSGDYVMKLVLTDLPSPDMENGAYNELGTSFSANFDGKESVSFSLLVEKGSNTNLQMPVVIKVSNDYKWSPAQEHTIDFSTIQQGIWQTITIPVEAFKYEEQALNSSDLADVKEILFQYWAVGETYTGTIYFDNIMLDDDMLFDFNEEGSVWSSAANESNVGLVKKEDVTSICPDFKNNRVKDRSSPSLQVINNKVAFNLETASSVELSVYTPMGMLVRRLETGRLKAGVHTIMLKNLTSGFYFVSLKNGNMINTKTMLAR